MKYDLSKYLYHAIMPTYWDYAGCADFNDSLRKLGMILERNSLLTKQSLMGKIDEKELKRLKENKNWNGDDCLSFAFSPENKKIIDLYKDDYNLLLNSYEASAWNMFVMELYPSLIFDEELFSDERIILPSEVKKRMNGELQIRGDVSLKHLMAIGIRVGIYGSRSYVSYIDSLDKRSEEIKYFEGKPCVIKDRVEETRKILNKYNIDIPIIDLENGNEIIK